MASTLLPVKQRCRASPSPMIQRRGVTSGGMPNLISGCPKTAAGEQIRMSQSFARSNPPASAGPFTAAMVGFGKYQRSR
ncbi:MAG: hypothetical protein A4E67_00081 [Syntrophaceae bacterium PtaB.Bin038]|nr:MAG: hypothetical protein A4E67_00081 [Syntrophaceae bacterium PtaB.Bin038]